MELVEKCWEFSLWTLEEGFLYDSIQVWAKTRNQAKVKMVAEANHNCCELIGGEEITYLNVPMRRNKEYDTYLIDGKVKTLRKYEQDKRDQERLDKLDKMLEEDPNGYAYIYKGGYYRPNSCGYTNIRARAGLYTLKEAVSSAKSCRDIDVIQIKIEDHNKMVREEIKELEGRLIKEIKELETNIMVE